MVKTKVEKKVKGPLEKKKLKNWASMSRTAPWMMGRFFLLLLCPLRMNGMGKRWPRNG
jgi:hypothetical protein